jgi:hypothetical protein
MMQDQTMLVLNNWLQLLTVVLANLGAVWWFRKESREDWKMCDKDIKEYREEFRSDTRERREEFKEFREMWLAESRDFHERLLKIEMERKKWL